MGGHGVMLKGSMLTYLPSLRTDICIRLTHGTLPLAGAEGRQQDAISGRSLCTQKQKVQRLGPKPGSSPCDWTFALHFPEYF